MATYTFDYRADGEILHTATHEFSDDLAHRYESEIWQARDARGNGRSWYRSSISAFVVRHLGHLPALDLFLVMLKSVSARVANALTPSRHQIRIRRISRRRDHFRMGGWSAHSSGLQV
jgi:hypothetical protein